MHKNVFFCLFVLKTIIQKDEVGRVVGIGRMSGRETVSRTGTDAQMGGAHIGG